MLLSISRQIRRLDATHNDLGTMGCIALFEGLMAVRARFSAQSDDFWGMREINLAANAIGDEGLVAAMFYCAKDMCMKELLLQRNRVTVSSYCPTECLCVALEPGLDPGGTWGRRTMSYRPCRVS